MRILGLISVGFAAGAALLLGLGLETAGAVLGILALVLAIPFWRGHRRVGCLLLGFGLGLLWTLGYRSLVVEPQRAICGSTRLVLCTATDYSRPTTYGIRVEADISDGAARAHGVLWLSEASPLKPGDTLTVVAELREPDSLRYAAQGIHVLAYGKMVTERTTADPVPLWYLPRAMAHRLEQALRAVMPEDTLGYGLALTTGDRQELTAAEQENLRDSGIYHIMALSGLHLTVLVGSLGLLIRRRRRRALLAIPLCILFTLLTGGRASLVRAAVMACVMLMAPVFRREQDGLTSLGVAVLLLTVQNPWCLFGWGLQLSVLSMAGLLLWSDRLYRVFCGVGPGLGRLGRYLRANLAATLGASAAVTPLLMVYFGRISLVAPLTNLLCGWAVGWAFRGSLLTAVVGCISTRAGAVLGWCVSWLIRYIQTVAAVLSRPSFAAIGTGSVYGIGWVVLVYCLGYLLWRQRRDGIRLVIPGCCVVLALIAALVFGTLEAQRTALTMLDVGQGQCILLRSGGECVLVDCGGSAGDHVGEQAVEALRDTGGRRISLLILTHFDWDHISGVETLLAGVPVERLLIPDRDDVPENLLLAAENAGTEVIFCTEKTTVRLPDGHLTVYPAGDGGNDGLALWAFLPGLSVLVTGDMDDGAERQLVESGCIPDVDVLVAGHHGAESSTSEELLEAARPEIVLISVGENRYGHPSAAVLERLREKDIAVFRTDEFGTLKLRG